MQDALDKLSPELKEVFTPFFDEHKRLHDDHKRLQMENVLLREQLRLALIDKYGPRSEKLSDEQLDLLEGEPSVTSAEVEQEAVQADPPKTKRKRQKKHPGRTRFVPARQQASIR